MPSRRLPQFLRPLDLRSEHMFPNRDLDIEAVNCRHRLEIRGYV